MNQNKPPSGQSSFETLVRRLPLANSFLTGFAEALQAVPNVEPNFLLSRNVEPLDMEETLSPCTGESSLHSPFSENSSNYTYLSANAFAKLSIDQKLSEIYSALSVVLNSANETSNSNHVLRNPSLEQHPRKEDFIRWMKIWFAELRTPVFVKSETVLEREITSSGIFTIGELKSTQTTKFQKELASYFQRNLNSFRGNARKKILGLKEYRKYHGCSTKELAERLFPDLNVTSDQLKKAALMRQVAIKRGYMTEPSKDEHYWTTFHEIHTSICAFRNSDEVFTTILLEDSKLSA